MDVALKQRLVGASVLVIFSVTFIPMLLDGPPSSRVEAPIAIPQPPDARFETRLLPVGQDPASAASSAQSLPAQQSRPAAVVTRSSENPKPQATVQRKEPVPASASSSTLPAESAPRARTPVATPPSNRNEQSGGQASGRWILQVGSFGNAANAARLVERLKGGQWQAYQERVEVGSNALYRVRVRGWPDKGAALDAGERLLKEFSDLEMSVRDIESNAIAANSSSKPAASLQGWMVQMGSFNSKNNATALRDRLRGSGFSAHVSDAGAGASARYRVRVGPDLDEARAKSTREKIRQQLGLTGMVIDHP